MPTHRYTRQLMPRMYFSVPYNYLVQMSFMSWCIDYKICQFCKGRHQNFREIPYLYNVKILSILTSEFPFFQLKREILFKDRRGWGWTAVPLHCKDREFPRNFDAIPKINFDICQWVNYWYPCYILGLDNPAYEPEGTPFTRGYLASPVDESQVRSNVYFTYLPRLW